MSALSSGPTDYTIEERCVDFVPRPSSVLVMVPPSFLYSQVQFRDAVAVCLLLFHDELFHHRGL